MSRGSCIVYEHTDYKGSSFLISGEEKDFRSINFNDKVSSIVVHSGVWLFYEHTEYKGKVMVLYPGSYPDIRSMGFNDIISSCRSLAGNGSTPQLYLFAGKNYGGRMVSFTRSDPNLVDNGFNDATSSVIVLGGKWDLYKHIRYDTRLRTFGYGCYSTLDWEADNQVSSVQLVGYQ